MRFFKLVIFVSALLLPILASANVSTLVADTKSGLILASKNATRQQYPASLTKVMTLYLTFSAIDKGILKMDDRLPVSLKAARQPRSKLYVKAGQTLSVRDAIMALIIISANDVAVVLAEALAPTEEEFAKMMTKTARELGLKSTTFKNASGLHNPNQVTTAQDMAILAMAMIHHFPHHYKLFSKRSFTYKGRTYRSHNHVQKKYRGAEGLKTGYISAVGYNIISTAKRNNNRLVSVVIGQDTVALRDRQAMNLLDRGFSKIKKHKSAKSGKNLLNKKAIVAKPDLMPQLKIMANRLDKVVKSKTPINRSKLLALNPFGIKTAHASEEKAVPSPALSQTPETDSLVEQGSNIAAEAAAEAISDKKENEETKTATPNTLEEQTKEEIDSKEKEPLTETPIPTNEIQPLKESVQEPKENNAPVEEIVVSGVVKPSNETLLQNQTQEDVQQIEKEDVRKENLESTQTPATVLQPGLTPLAQSKESVSMEKQTGQGYGIQVGAFNSKEIALQQANRALKVLKIRNKEILTPPNGKYHRARIYGFYSKKAAQNACRKLKQKKIPCMPLAKEK